jgi:hypothetical protein
MNAEPYGGPKDNRSLFENVRLRLEMFLPGNMNVSFKQCVTLCVFRSVISYSLQNECIIGGVYIQFNFPTRLKDFDQIVVQIVGRITICFITINSCVKLFCIKPEINVTKFLKTVHE